MIGSHRITLALAGFLGLLAATIYSYHVPAAVPPIAQHALLDGFEAAMAHTVVEWDPADTRPRDVKRRALADFVYSTYQSSAWIPQSLFNANVVSQAVAGDVATIVGEKVGLVLWRDNPLVMAYGMAPNVGGRDSLEWTVNCIVCHTAEIDGVTYFGAGSKTFDDRWLGEALKRLTGEPWRTWLRGGIDRAHAADAHRILTSHHHDAIDSLTRGRSTAFAASHVELFMRTHGGAMPSVPDVGRGDVKTPPLWHTAAKMPHQRWYSDGSFAGAYPLMASSMELEKDRSFDALVTHVIPAIKTQFDAVVRHLRPPRYPYPIDSALADRGRALFYSPAVGCSGCHGVYDGQGNVDWPGVHLDVGTDRARRELVTPQFIDAFDRSPLAASGRLAKSEGYAATPLTGVWANYPYLHNGSVPTLHHLLGPVGERPPVFEVMAARRFDPAHVGQRLYDDRYNKVPRARWPARFGADRNWFSVHRPGSSNAGHDVWERIGNDANRRALIEYLKTL